MVHNDDVNRDSTITLRLPGKLKRRLEARARKMRRSLSAQVVHDLENLMESMPSGGGGQGSFLGLYEGARLPSDAEIEEVRSFLWGSWQRRGENS